MARKKTSNFVIGLFVTVGTVIAVVAIVWLSAAKYFEKGFYIVTYFDESVQGLQKDSAVKYRGIDIGNVEKIGVAPDRRMIEVLMKITMKPKAEDEIDAAERELREKDEERPLREKFTCQLKSAGITGIVFVEVNEKRPGDEEMEPKLTFEPDYEYVPSVPSNIKQLQMAIELVVDKVQELDFAGISDQAKDSVKAVEDFFSGEKMENVMANLDSITARVDDLIAHIQEQTEDAPIEAVLVEAENTLVDVQELVENLNRSVEELNLGQAADKVEGFVDNLNRGTRAITMEIRATSESLRRSTESLELLINRLEATPSDVIFSSPPPARRGE
jgi:phospholipid/cholesterol/gamma-HCH transport system substrate-binding protein